MTKYNKGTIRWEDYMHSPVEAITAKQFRVIIPQMFREYKHPDKRKLSKVRGMWLEENKPDDWPVEVDFRDPNNEPKFTSDQSKIIFIYLRKHLLKTMLSANGLADCSGAQPSPVDQTLEALVTTKTSRRRSFNSLSTRPLLSDPFPQSRTSQLSAFLEPVSDHLPPDIFGSEGDTSQHLQGVQSPNEPSRVLFIEQPKASTSTQAQPSPSMDQIPPVPSAKPKESNIQIILQRKHNDTAECDRTNGVNTTIDSSGGDSTLQPTDGTRDAACSMVVDANLGVFLDHPTVTSRTPLDDRPNDERSPSSQVHCPPEDVNEITNRTDISLIKKDIIFGNAIGVDVLVDNYRSQVAEFLVAHKRHELKEFVTEELEKSNEDPNNEPVVMKSEVSRGLENGNPSSNVQVQIEELGICVCAGRESTVERNSPRVSCILKKLMELDHSKAPIPTVVENYEERESPPLKRQKLSKGKHRQVDLAVAETGLDCHHDPGGQNERHKGWMTKPAEPLRMEWSPLSE